MEPRQTIISGRFLTVLIGGSPDGPVIDAATYSPRFAIGLRRDLVFGLRDFSELVFRIVQPTGLDLALPSRSSGGFPR